MRNLIFFSYLSILFFTSCAKDTSVIPTSTPTNSGLSFKMDGTSDFQSSFVAGAWDTNQKILNITSKSGKSYFIVSLDMPNGLKAGTYSFTAGSSSGLTDAVFRADSTITSADYHSNIDATTNGSLTISGMTPDSIITGSFSFNLKSPVTNKTMKITSGTFSSVKVTLPKVTLTTSQITTMKVDGKAFKASLVDARVISIGTKQISITAVTSTESISLTLPENTVAGTYTFDNSSGYSASYSPNTMTLDSYFPKSGTNQIVIQSHDKANRRVKGTFKFTAGEILPTTGKTFAITEGVFDLKY